MSKLAGRGDGTREAAVVRRKPEEFTKLLGCTAQPLVVYAEGGVFRTNYQYLTSYKGLAFFARSSEAIPLPAGNRVDRRRQDMDSRINTKPDASISSRARPIWHVV
ncbi:MAG: hypothetical protein ACLQU1_18340 [Bryobacteraceae bacterium]